MMTEYTETLNEQESKQREAALRSLDRLIGTWHVTGTEMDGNVIFEWMEGGAFFIQHVDLDQGGEKTKGMEIIGWDKESQSLKSHYFDQSGSILEYAWEVSDEALVIWFGEVGSAARYEGRWSEDGNQNVGSWMWPGGGYDSTMTRVG